MVSEIVVIISAAIPSLLSGIILSILKSNQDKAMKKEEELNEREQLTLKSLDALFSVSKELYEVVMDKKLPNGDLDKAYKYKEEVKHALEEYERRRASKS